MMPGPMNEDIRQLLVLQDRDAKASRLEAELESIDPEREKTGGTASRPSSYWSRSSRIICSWRFAGRIWRTR
ncbi:MAG: hypothetical protein Ct9H300mP7_6600 [Verrucomicrobiota bacterium]|nr:MAG: hypothetical protein Ct9H300mP7_6600 [Verrucomicrobiota bacterium]